MDRLQVNFRLDKDLAEKLDRRRITLMETLGRIPTRSEVLRLALDLYLKNQDEPDQIPK